MRLRYWAFIAVILLAVALLQARKPTRGAHLNEELLSAIRRTRRGLRCMRGTFSTCPSRCGRLGSV